MNIWSSQSKFEIIPDITHNKPKVYSISLFLVSYRCQRLNISQYICRISNITSAYMKDVNRLKLVLVEQKRTGKWLAEQLGKDPSTVSKWCSNVTQPTLDTLVNIAKVLDVDIKDLINNK